MSRQLTAAGEEGLVHAILIVPSGDDLGGGPEDLGVAARVIAQASAGTGRHPVGVRYLPRAGAVIVTASASYVRALLDDHRVAVASATTIDLFPW